MIGAALRATWAAIPAATAAPGEQEQRQIRAGSSVRGAAPPRGSAAGLIASCGAARDAGGRSNSRSVQGASNRTKGWRKGRTRRRRTRHRYRQRTRVRGRPVRDAGGLRRCGLRANGRPCPREGVLRNSGRGRSRAAERRGPAAARAGSATGGSATTSWAGAALRPGSTGAAGFSTAGAGADSGADAGSGAAAGAGSGADRGALAGSSRVGSTYPFGSAATRIPRWTWGAIVAASSLSPTFRRPRLRRPYSPRATATDAELEQRHRVAVGGLDRQRAAASRDRAGERDGAGGGRADVGAGGSADVDSAVLAGRVLVLSEREWPQNRSVGGPGPGDRGRDD